LADITSSHNSRNPLPNMTAAGITADPRDESDLPLPIDLVKDLALSDSPEDREKFVALIDEHESEGLDSIKALAEGGAGVPGLKDGQLQAVCLTSYRIKAKDPETGKRIVRYRIIFGERRILATAYLFAKYGRKYSSVLATVVRATKDKSYNMGIAENFLRRNPAPSEVALTYKDLKSDGMSIADIAEMFFSGNPRKSGTAAYQEVRSMLKLVTGKHQLTHKELLDLDGGKIGLTQAKNKAGGLGPVGHKNENPRRTVGIKQAEDLLDDTVRAFDALDEGADGNQLIGYIGACADLMRYETIEEAINDSRKRLADAEVELAPVIEAA